MSMNEFEQLSPKTQERIDTACDRYVSALKQGDAPEIRQFLRVVEGDMARRVLFNELVVGDLMANHQDRANRIEEIRREFPEYRETVDSISTVLSVDSGTSEETNAGSSRLRSISKSNDLHQLGKYKLLDKVGQGAFGEVWKAQDTKLNRIVAIKMPKGRNLDSFQAERFSKEAELAARLKHSNIVTVHEIGQSDNLPYIVTDFIDGRSVTEWKAYCNPSPIELTRLCIAIADALHHAHENGVVHRDLKPTNVLVDANNTPHIADFGLAKSLSDDTMTVAGSLLGSPAYMPPEQAKGDAYKADGRSDIYSLGVLLYELLVGERPFRGSPESVLHQVTYVDPVAPRTLDSNVPLDLETITLKCLNKDPQQRYQSGRRLADDLRRFERGEPISARPVTRVERAWRWSKRNPAFAVAVCVASTLLCLLAVGGQWAATRQTRLTRKAKQESYVYQLASVAQALRFNNFEEARQLLGDMERDEDIQEWLTFEFRYLNRQASTDDFVAYPGGRGGLAISHSGNLAGASGRNGLRIWDLESGKDVHHLEIEVGGANPLAFSPDDRLLACRMKDHNISLVDLATGNVTREFSTGELNAWTLAYSHDGQTIAYGSFIGHSIHLIDVETGQERVLQANDSLAIFHLAFSPTDDLLASAGLDGKVAW